MIALLFSVGADRYALPARDIVEVLPLVALKRVPPAPPYLAGLLNYHGAAVPVIDLNLLMNGRACERSLSSRILLTRYRVSETRIERLGLMVERAVETANIDPDALISPGIGVPGAPYLGKLALRGGELAQLVQAEQLLSESARALLYPEEESSGDGLVSR
jgi:chemotaxis-related protein WspB